MEAPDARFGHHQVDPLGGPHPKSALEACQGLELLRPHAGGGDDHLRSSLDFLPGFGAHKLGPDDVAAVT